MRGPMPLQLGQVVGLRGRRGRAAGAAFAFGAGALPSAAFWLYLARPRQSPLTA